MEDLVFAPAHVQASLIRDRQVSASELLEAHLGQITRHNPQLNAIVTLDEDAARQRAQAADTALAKGDVWGPLHGVPFTVKDALETAGLRTTVAIPAFKDYVPASDAPTVARLRAAGGILLGKTNLPTGSADFQTDNPLFGRTNNPWDVSRTPGGSTGGGGAAVAAGLTPLELGGDYGGSIRIPAHYCGVYGLKPTQHRIPARGYLCRRPEELRYRQSLTVGPLARSVEDLRLTLRLLAGPDPWEWEVPPVPVETVSYPLERLRLAWADGWGSTPVSAETRAALAHLAGALRQRGATVEHVVLEALDVGVAAQTHAFLGQAEREAAVSPEAEAAAVAERGGSPITVREYKTALAQRDALSATLEQFFDGWDALLCPVTAGPAFVHCPTGAPISVDGQEVPYWAAGTSYTVPFNVTGHPGLVLPLTLSADGLPIGVQLVGRRWSEMQLLAIADQLSDLVRGFHRPPGY